MIGTVAFGTNFGTIGNMDRAGKKLPAAFFCTEQGAEPVREWLRSAELTDQDRKLIGEDIKTVKFGWPVGMPTCRPLSSGVWEIRTTLRDRAARVLFCVAQGHLVLLHGFIKKSRETPAKDLSLAVARKRAVEKAT